MLPHRIRNPIGLPLLPIAVCLLDVALTLYGQPNSYWQGDYGTVLEGNPVPRYFLEIHPLAFAVLVVFWITCFSVAILFLPRGWATRARRLIVIGHSIGAISWMIHGISNTLQR